MRYVGLYQCMVTNVRSSNTWYYVMILFLKKANSFLHLSIKFLICRAPGGKKGVRGIAESFLHLSFKFLTCRAPGGKKGVRGIAKSFRSIFLSFPQTAAVERRFNAGYLFTVVSQWELSHEKEWECYIMTWCVYNITVTKDLRESINEWV